MILYLSGNFPQLVSPGKESTFRTDLLSKGRPYHRLVTRFYPKHCETVFGILKDEEKEVWHRAYMDRMIEVAKLSEEHAQEALDAAMGEYDYTMDPKDMADEEMSYWTED
jgi:hypothetical protein